MMRRLCTAVAVLALLAAAGSILAQDQPTQAEKDTLIGPPAGPPLEGSVLIARTEEVALLMRCPVCQGLSIADSPTLLAQAMKSEVQDLLAQGYSEEQVMTYFEASYGEFIRLAPKARGFNLLVWLAPIGALALGAWFVVARGRSAKPVVRDERQEAADPELESYRDQVRQDLGAPSEESVSAESTAEESTR